MRVSSRNEPETSVFVGISKHQTKELMWQQYSSYGLTLTFKEYRD